MSFITRKIKDNKILDITNEGGSVQKNLIEFEVLDLYGDLLDTITELRQKIINNSKLLKIKDLSYFIEIIANLINKNETDYNKFKHLLKKNKKQRYCRNDNN